MLLYGNILFAEEKNYTTINYEAWRDLTIETKLIYVTGYIHGEFTVTETVIQKLNLDFETSEVLRGFITPYYNHDIAVAVDWLYSEEYFRSFPVYNLINNLDEYLRLRKRIYDNKEKNNG